MKTADVSEVTAAGQPIQFSFVVTNDGNVTLSPVTVSYTHLTLPTILLV